ncbi:MAG: rod shape-determining protein MreD, partial [Lachnospiraceae bacterium]|nr:rod shape-determining protein MreD [Lachnospiraceae bacterium]
MKKTLATVIIVLIAYLLQTTLIQGIALGGVMPNLILLVTAYVGYINGRVSGTITGMVFGF